ncbi:MAG: type II toxin-antitoxin system prevent-host-death family antitoxin [Chlamydiales bacterium]
MKTSIRELRNSMKRVLERVQHGEEIEVYSREIPIAKIIPIKKVSKTKEDYGFGMWKDREEFKDVDKYVRNLRKGRSYDV